MNRFWTISIAALAGVLASCGSSVTSSTKAPTNVTYSMAVSPDRLTLNEGDYASISATVDESYLNGTPKAVSPQPTIKFYSADTRITVSPSGQVCAGQWDERYMNCTATTPVVQCTAGASPTVYCQNLPANPVYVSAYAAAKSVGGSVPIYIHPRAARITLCAPTQGGGTTTECSGSQSTFNSVTGTYSSTNVTRTASGYYPSDTNCVSQNHQVKYFAQAYDASGNPIDNCAVNNIAGCVNDLDFTWSVTDGTVAAAGEKGGVVAKNPGVTTVYAKLNGTVSTPLSFATCPPAAITMASSNYTKGAAAPPYATTDLTSLYKGSLQYFTATSIVDTNGNAMPLVDTAGNALNSLSLTFSSSERLDGSFQSVQPLTSQFTATTSGRSLFSISCTPSTCNPAAADFVSPTGAAVNAASVGYGYPIYSNVIGGLISGTTSSIVLVTGTEYPNASSYCTGSGTCTPPQPHELLVYDSESMGLTHTINLPNLPNSLVVAPNGTTAYVGSDAGLQVITLSNYQSAVMVYPIVGGLNTDVITGKVLGVSPDSRYVVISDIANGLVFLVDTTTTKKATRYTIPNIKAVAFASDMSNFWIGGDSGVYVYESDTFVQTQYNASTNVTALAWTPDGQSYFAAGSQLTNYSTCNDKNPQNLGAGPVNLDTTAINGTQRVFGLSGSKWLDYAVTSSSQAGSSPLVGNVCLSTVKVAAPVSASSTLGCTAKQFTYSTRLEQEYVTGVDPSCTTSESVIHGYDLTSQAEVTLTASSPLVPLSGGMLSDGRSLFIGSGSSTATAAYLHRFNLLTSTGTTGTLAEDTTAVSVPVVPSFVAVVPK